MAINSHVRTLNLRITDGQGNLKIYTYDDLQRISTIQSFRPTNGGFYSDEDQSFDYDEGVNGKGRLTGLSVVNYNYDNISVDNNAQYHYDK